MVARLWEPQGDQSCPEEGHCGYSPADGGRPVALAHRASEARRPRLEDGRGVRASPEARARFAAMKQTDREDLKRRTPGAALGLATARSGDWACSFPDRDRMSQLVPSLRGRVRIAGGATALSRCRCQENVLKLGSGRKGKKRRS